MLLPLLLASALQLRPAAAVAPDSLTGTWRLSGDVAGNPVNELCTLRQAGAKITGNCRNTDDAGARAFDVTGEVNGDTVKFAHGGEYQGQALTITYAGTLAAARQLKGSVDVQPFGVTGTFTAAPAATPAAPPAAASAPAKP